METLEVFKLKLSVLEFLSVDRNKQVGTRLYVFLILLVVLGAPSSVMLFCCILFENKRER